MASGDGLATEPQVDEPGVFLFNKIMSWQHQFKLPPLSKFKGSKKSNNPYNLLYEWLIPQIGGIESNPGMSVSDVVVNPFDYKILESLVKAWAIKQNPYYSPHQLTQVLGWLSLQNAPAESPEVPSGHIYVRMVQK